MARKRRSILSLGARSRMLVFVLLGLGIAGLACNAPGFPQLLANPAATQAGPALTQPSPNPTTGPGPTEPVARELELAGRHPCDLVTLEHVQSVLDGEVTPSARLDQDLPAVTCSYSTPDTNVSATLYEGDGGRRELLAIYGQMTAAQECSLSLSFSTEPQTPTPLPPDLQQHLDKGLDEIYLMQRAATYEYCSPTQALTELMPWDDFGPSAYTSKKIEQIFTFVPTGEVHLLQPEAALTITVAGTGGVVDPELLAEYNELSGQEGVAEDEIAPVFEQVYEQTDGLIELAKELALLAFEPGS